MSLEKFSRQAQIGVALALVLLSALILAACGPSDPSPTNAAPNANAGENAAVDGGADSSGGESLDASSASGGYPVGAGASQGYPGSVADVGPDSGYPAPDLYEDLLSEPPNPAVDLPVANEEAGVIGGVLIRQVLDFGFEPLMPAAVLLADVLTTSDGQPAFLRAGDSSQQAELFPTGIFIFQNVPPGDYGLMVDVGYTQFPINGDDGSPLIISVEAGGVVDLGQVITQLPAE